MTPDWHLLNYLALDPDNLPSVLAGMGFTLRLTSWPRSTLASWPNTDWTVYLLALPTRRCILLDTGSGHWRDSLLGAPRGHDLISLGSWTWSCRYGRSAWRIARTCGLRHLPDRAWRGHDRQ